MLPFPEIAVQLRRHLRPGDLPRQGYGVESHRHEVVCTRERILGPRPELAEPNGKRPPKAGPRLVLISLSVKYEPAVVDVARDIRVVVAEGLSVDSLGFLVAAQRPVRIAFGLKHAAAVVDVARDIGVVVAEGLAVDAFGFLDAAQSAVQIALGLEQAAAVVDKDGEFRGLFVESLAGDAFGFLEA